MVFRIWNGAYGIWIVGCSIYYIPDSGSYINHDFWYHPYVYVAFWAPFHGSRAPVKGMEIQVYRDVDLNLGLSASAALHSRKLTWNSKRGTLKRTATCKGPLSGCMLVFQSVAVHDPPPKSSHLRTARLPVDSKRIPRALGGTPNRDPCSLWGVL